MEWQAVVLYSQASAAPVQNAPKVHDAFGCGRRLRQETAARAEEVLSADIADLDVENKRLRVRSKGGDADWLHFQSGSARLHAHADTGIDDQDL